MAHDFDEVEYNGNKRNRERAKGSLADRVDFLERMLLSTVDKNNLSKKDKDHLKKIEKSDTDHPESDD